MIERIESLDELIRLKHEQIRLLEELRVQFEFLARADLKPADVYRCGYDRNKDERFTRWTAIEQQKIGTPLMLNYAILKDGSRVDVPIPWKELRDKYRAEVRAKIEVRRLGRAMR